MSELLESELIINGGTVSAKCPKCNIISPVVEGLLNIKVLNGVMSQVYLGSNFNLLCGHTLGVGRNLTQE